jgi:A/G-specific adenine glycosylase
MKPAQSTSHWKPDLHAFREHLLSWYLAHARDLPWRQQPGKQRAGKRHPGKKKHRNPYHVWVSEIMLQQTRVAAVIEHYRKFLQRFPTVEKLASAREASVLAAWSGLGYYRRARMMHAAAKVVMRERDGEFPETSESWRELPGIGRYTAAAIASIAFGEAVAVVDGNVERVLQRFLGQPLAGEGLWRAADDLLDRQRPGDFNQAMMELGATVCTPRAPACLMCPVVELCATRGELAGKAKAEKQKKREIHYALHYRPNGRSKQVLLVKRSKNASLMAGMWELPEIRYPQDRGKPAFTVRHSITVTDYTVQVWHNPVSNHKDGEWFPSDRLPKLPLTGLARKILRRADLLAQSKSRTSKALV